MKGRQVRQILEPAQASWQLAQGNRNSAPSQRIVHLRSAPSCSMHALESAWRRRPVYIACTPSVPIHATAVSWRALCPARIAGGLFCGHTSPCRSVRKSRLMSVMLAESGAPFPTLRRWVWPIAIRPCTRTSNSGRADRCASTRMVGWNAGEYLVSAVHGGWHGAGKCAPT